MLRAAGRRPYFLIENGKLKIENCGARRRGNAGTVRRTNADIHGLRTLRWRKKVKTVAVAQKKVMFFVYYGRRLSLTLVSKNGKVIKTTR